MGGGSTRVDQQGEKIEELKDYILVLHSRS